jgi:hypothetical protein
VAHAHESTRALELHKSSLRLSSGRGNRRRGGRAKSALRLRRSNEKEIHLSRFCLPGFSPSGRAGRFAHCIAKVTMANTLANSLAAIQPVPPLVARGGALRTFGGLAFLLAVILSLLGAYLIQDQFTNPLASQPLGLFAAAFLLATAMALVYELVQLPTSIWWTGNETSLVPRTSTRPVRVPGQRPPGATKNSHPASPIPPSPVSIPNHHASNLGKVPAPTVRPSSTLPAPVADPRPPSLAKPPAATPTPAPLVRVTD